MMPCDLPPFRSAMKPTPHASYSRRGSNRPLGLGKRSCRVGHSHRVLRSHGFLQQSRQADRCHALTPRPLPEQMAPRAPCCSTRSQARRDRSAMTQGAQRRRSIGPPPSCRAASPSPGSDGFRSAASGAAVRRRLSPLILWAAGCPAYRIEAESGAVHCTKQPPIKDSIADLNSSCKDELQAARHPRGIFRRCGVRRNCATLSGTRRERMPQGKHASQTHPPFRNLAIAQSARSLPPAAAGASAWCRRARDRSTGAKRGPRSRGGR